MSDTWSVPAKLAYVQKLIDMLGAGQDDIALMDRIERLLGEVEAQQRATQQAAAAGGQG